MILKIIKKRGLLISVFLMLPCLAGLVFFYGCNVKKEPYISFYDKASFANLFEKKPTLCILTCTVDPVIYDAAGKEFDIYPGFLPGEKILKKNSPYYQAEKKIEIKRMTEGLSFNHLQHTISVFSRRFQLVSLKKYEDIKTNNLDKQTIIKMIKDGGADFGLMMHNQFGAKWQNNNTGIDSYYFQFVTVIYDQKGNLVWRYCGKGCKQLIVDLSLRGLAEGFAGTVSSASMINGFRPIYTKYPQFLLFLIEDDVLNKMHGAKVTDYFKIKKFKEYFDVYNYTREDVLLPDFPKPKLILLTEDSPHVKVAGN